MLALLAAATAMAGWLAQRAPAGLPQRLGFSTVSLAEGLMFLALAAASVRGSRAARLIAAALVLVDAALLAFLDRGVPDFPAAVLLALRLTLAGVLLVPPRARKQREAATVPIPMAMLEAISKASPSPPPEPQQAVAPSRVEMPKISAPPVMSPDSSPEPSTAPAKEPAYAEPARPARPFACVPDPYGLIRCPKCSFRQIEHSSCFFCHTDFASYFEARQRARELRREHGKS